MKGEISFCIKVCNTPVMPAFKCVKPYAHKDTLRYTVTFPNRPYKSLFCFIQIMHDCLLECLAKKTFPLMPDIMCMLILYELKGVNHRLKGTEINWFFFTF